VSCTYVFEIIFVFCLCLNTFLCKDLLKISLNNSDLRSQSKQIVYNVYTFLKELSSKPDLTSNFFKHTQICTGEACGLSKRTVRRICSEAKHSEDKPDESKSVLSFKSPR